MRGVYLLRAARKAFIDCKSDDALREYMDKCDLYRQLTLGKKILANLTLRSPDTQFYDWAKNELENRVSSI